MSYLYLSVELGELYLLLISWKVQVWWLEATVKVGATASTGFGGSIEIVKEGIHLVEVLLGDGVIFVVMADSASEGEAHKGGANRGYTVNHVFEVALLGKGSTAVNDEMKPVETGGDELFLCGFLV